MNQHGYHQTHETQPSRIMFLNTKDAQIYGNKSHFSYVFGEGMETSSNEGVLVSLVSASIPYSFYNIRQNVNNRVSYKVSNFDGSSDHTGSLFVPPGNYTATSLASDLKDLFEDASFPLACSVTVTHSKITQKFSIQVLEKNDTNGRKLTLLFNTSGNTDLLAQELGFDLSQDVATSHSPGSLSAERIPIVSSLVVDVGASVHAVYVRTNLSTKSVLDSQTGGISDILTKIDINTNPGGLITLDPAQATHESLIYTKSIKDIFVRITDERDRLLDLNGLDLQIALKFRFVERRKSSVAQGELDPRRRAYEMWPQPKTPAKKKKGKKKSATSKSK